MKTFLRILSILALHLIISGLSFGQSADGQVRLVELSERFNQRFLAEKSEAINRATELGIPVRQEFEGGGAMELMYFRNGRPHYYTTQNAGGATLIKTDKIYEDGGAGLELSGAGQTLGIWDAGKVRNTHQELTGRVTQQDAATTNNNHATHVAGTLIASGVDAAAKGMSFAASLHAWDWNNDESEMAAAAANGLRVSQHSYGLVTGWYYNFYNDGYWAWFGDIYISQTEDYNFGFYSEEAYEWDEIAYNAPNYLIVKSAGNPRGIGPTPGTYHWIWDEVNEEFVWTNTTRDINGGVNGYDCIAHSASSKNILTVGAVNQSKAMYVNGGWGPTDDGRIKPDIVAKGVSVYSSLAGSNTSYDSWNGTSMAGPMVSGSVGLLLEYQQNLHPGEALLSSTLKALVIHTADEAVSGNPGPDYRFGWGLMDTEKAAKVMTDNAASPGLHILEETIREGETITIPVMADGVNPLRATIVWNDLPGTPPAPSLNPTDLMLVNDLDMRIMDYDHAIHQPYILDPSNPAQAATTGDNFRDNLEMVHISSTQNKLYLIEISHKATLTGGSQLFSLIVTGNEDFDREDIISAADDVSNYTGWNVYDNEGYGFKSWQFFQAGSGGSYIGSTGLEDPSFGIYAGGDGAGNYFTARRDFGGKLATGASFSIRLGYTSVSNGGEIGMSFFSDGDFRLTFKFIGGGTWWQINDGGSDFDTNIPFADNTPLEFTLTKGAGNNYSLLIQQGAATYNANNYTASSGAFDINRIEIFSVGQGAGNNLGFNDLEIKTDFTHLAELVTNVVVGNVILDENIEVENLVVGKGNMLDISAGNQLTVAGQLMNAAGASGLIIQSDITGTGSMIHHSTGVEGIMQRHISAYSNNADGWHLLASPVNNFAIAGSDFEPGTVAPNLDDFYAWDEATYTWLNYKVGANNITNFINGRGYLVAYQTTATKDFVGTFNNSDITHTNLSKGTGNGWHLLGNPFQSALQWTDTDWARINIAAGAKIMNSGGTYTDIVVSGNDIIPANQGFFVQATVDASNSITIPASQRVHNTAAFYKSAPANFLTLRAADGEFYVETWIQIMNDATPGFDVQYDMNFLGGMYQAPYFYSKISENERLSTNRIPLVETTATVQLGFRSFLDRQFTITAQGAGSFSDSLDIILEDVQVGVQIDLRKTGDYKFQALANEVTDRFRIHFVKATRIDENLMQPGFSIYSFGNTIYILGKTTAGLQLEIFNMPGQRVYSGQIFVDGLTPVNPQLGRGWYVVKAVYGMESVSRKIFFE